jgi:DNA-binding CsgD family transcriptional regulator
MQAKWDLEFNVADRSFWREPIAAYTANRSLSLSRLVYWSYESVLPDLDEEVMICSIPLIDETGTVFGVCGFEISAMNFMLRYNPDAVMYPNTGFMFSAYEDSSMDIENALFSGNTAASLGLSPSDTLNPSGSIGSLTVYSASGRVYVGLNKEIELLVHDSPFQNISFAAAVIIPKADFDRMAARQVAVYAMILLTLLLLGIAASVILSKRYVKPITDRLAALALDSLPKKTNIAEIDLLIERIKANDRSIPDDLFDDFINRVKTLTPTQLVVFQCHAEGLSTEATLKRMFIAPGTLKNHNGQIFAKMKVSSQEELRLYISLLKKCGLMDQIFAEAEQREIEDQVQL